MRMPFSGVESLREALPERAKDLDLNLSSVFGTSGSLTEDQRLGVALACAIATENTRVREAILVDAQRIGGDALVEDARAAAALMAMNDVFHRFMHDVDARAPSRLHASRLDAPATNKGTFELMCLAVSALDGCEVCVRAHEAAVLAAGLTQDAIVDAVRIAATLRAVAVAIG